MVDDNDIRQWRRWLDRHGVDDDAMDLDRRMDSRELVIALASRVQDLEERLSKLEDLGE